MGVVGCGRYAADFARNLRVQSDEAGPEVDLYFASRDERRAQEYCQRFGGLGYFGSYEAAARDPRIAALYVCTPHHLHRQHCELGLAHGKHIMVEKPLAHTQEDALAIIEAAARAGKTLMVAENVRYLATGSQVPPASFGRIHWRSQVSPISGRVSPAAGKLAHSGQPERRRGAH